MDRCVALVNVLCCLANRQPDDRRMGVSRLRIRSLVITQVLRAGMAGLLGLSLAACAPRVRGPVKVAESDSGSMVELRVGEQVEIVLDSNPTAGYAWEVASEDVTVVRQVGDPQFKPDSEAVAAVGTPSRAVGGGGTLTLLFEAVAPGEQVLTLIYHRTFEQDVPPTRTFALDILVRER
jgi:predicted secreted protein